MQSRKRRITRDACSLGVIALAWAVGAGGSYAQDTPPGVVPGLYTDSRCDAANFPAEMPAVNAVLDSSTLVAALPRLGLDKSLVLTLRLGSLSHDPRVRVFKKKGST